MRKLLIATAIAATLTGCCTTTERTKAEFSMQDGMISTRLQ